MLAEKYADKTMSRRVMFFASVINVKLLRVVEWGQLSMESTSEIYGASPAIWDQTVLHTCHPTQLRTRPALTPASQSGTRFTYFEGMED